MHHLHRQHHAHQWQPERKVQSESSMSTFCARLYQRTSVQEMKAQKCMSRSKTFGSVAASVRSGQCRYKCTNMVKQSRNWRVTGPLFSHRFVPLRCSNTTARDLRVQLRDGFGHGHRRMVVGVSVVCGSALSGNENERPWH